jgi:hypothetical protein
MPTYIFKNKKTGIVYEDFMSITDMEKIISNPNMELVIDSVNIVSSQGDNIDAKTDAGWKETLAKISEAHPDSELTKQYGKRRSHKDVKVEKIRKKHRDKALRKAKGINELK